MNPPTNIEVLPALPTMRYSFCLLSLLVVTPAMADEISFNFDIRPILSDRCFLCHGPDADDRQADLRLDTAEGAYAALEFADASHVIKPGDPSQSEAYLRMTSDDPLTKMPPPETKLELTADEIATIKKWIEQGAPYESHWSFIPPRDVSVPAGNADWGQNEIDAFILKRMREHELTPNPRAAKEKLLRRVTFDLTGLPPTLEELDAFLNDDAPDAFEKVVDRLLDSEAYGERMTSDWLDVARYSDTYGYQVDRDRYVWPWRDWVIRAFNSNKPYDEFVTEQLAGDLLPNATDDQILATTFNRLHPQKVEGGSTPEEFRIEYVADRTQTFGTAFLGLTLECCRCHAHKYDPITQEEYYQFSAFFDNIDEAGLYSFFTPSIPTPTLLLANDGQKEKMAELRKQNAEAEQKLAAIAEGAKDDFAAWLQSDAEKTVSPQGELKHLDFEMVGGGNAKVEGVVGSAVKLSGDDEITTDVGNFKRYQPFSVALWMNTPDVKDRAVVFHRSRAWTDAGSRGYELLLIDGKLQASLIHFWPGNAISVQTKEPIPTSEWLHVVMTYDGSSRADGITLWVNGKPAECEIVRDNLTKQITGGGGDNVSIGARFRDRGFKQGLVDEFRVFDRQLTQSEVRQLMGSEENEPDLAFYLSTVNEAYKQQLDAVQAVRKQLCETIDPIPEIMVMRELDQPRTTHLLTRGAYDAKAKEVPAKVPAIFSQLPKDMPANRLALAKWLTDPEHPLTARVAVNHYWQMIFGTGLVRTPEDFGSQGQLPTHPDLLDWLSKDFVKHGWDVKRLIKQMVLSATYQQSSSTSPEKQQRDPENRWLSRAPSYRLPAEMLRDNALAVSGLLVNKIGGAPAKPYEVEVSFKPATKDKGAGLYRRSLYTYWKRTGPAPVMMTLDASKRDVCRVRREKTSSPLQALVLFNGPQFVEASRMLAQRVLKDTDENKAVAKVFRLLTSRQPDDSELTILRELYESQKQHFEANQPEAEKLLNVGETKTTGEVNRTQLAALTVVANTLMNFDECVTQR